MCLVDLNEVSCDRAINTDTNGEKDLWCSSTVQLLSTDVNGRICGTQASIYNSAAINTDTSECVLKSPIRIRLSLAIELSRHIVTCLADEQ